MNSLRFGILISLAAVLPRAVPIVLAAPLPEYVPGQVLVTFKPPVNDSQVSRFAIDHHAVIARQYRWLSQKRKQKSVLMRSDSKTTDELIMELRRNPLVETVEPNYRRRISTGYTPNDPRYGELWGLNNTGQTVNGTAGTANADVNFPEAWALSRTPASEVVVAVIDTGCDYRHPDLVSNMWCNAGEIPTNGIDDDGNGYVDDYHGFDFASTTNATPGWDADPMDDITDHGTHVCGTIAATGNNAAGIIGVNVHAKIMILKASGDGEYLTDASTLDAYDYAATLKTLGINVVAINASYGGAGFNSIEAAAISELGNLGIVFCAAAGNNGSSNETSPEYPASYTNSNIIAVAATDQKDTLASFSNYGSTSVDLAAPGVNILSCMPTHLAQTMASVRHGSTNYTAVGLAYAGATTGITATVINCDYGATGSFPPQVSNNIALIQRGPASNPLTFTEKVSNAMAAGAVAAVIYNNVSGLFTGTLQKASAWIPAVSISQANGQALVAAAPTSLTVVNQVIDPSAIYQFMNGTSMATPHVAGAISFLAFNFPEESVTQRIQRVLSNVTPITTLHSKVKSRGRLNLQKAIDTDSDNLPDWWEKRYFGGYTNGSPSADSNSNGTSNLAEWLAGASPTYKGAVLSIDSPLPISTGIVIRWSSETGNLYRVERSTNLMIGSGGFAPIAVDVAASPPSNTFTDSAPPAASAQFYRTQLQP